MSVTMSWDWRSLGSVRVGEEGTLAFPHIDADPAVFRLRFVEEDGSETYLHGHANSLTDAIQPFEKPDSSPRADVPVRERIRAVVVGGGHVEVEIMEDIDVQGVGPVYLPDALPREMLQRVAEMSVQDRLLRL